MYGWRRDSIYERCVASTHGPMEEKSADRDASVYYIVSYIFPVVFFVTLVCVLSSTIFSLLSSLFIPLHAADMRALCTRQWQRVGVCQCSCRYAAARSSEFDGGKDGARVSVLGARERGAKFVFIFILISQLTTSFLSLSASQQPVSTATQRVYAASECAACRAISLCIHEHEVNMFNTIVRLNRTQCVIFFPRHRIATIALPPAADSFIYLFLFYFAVLLRLMVLLALAIASTYPWNMLPSAPSGGTELNASQKINNLDSVGPFPLRERCFRIANLISVRSSRLIDRRRVHCIANGTGFGASSGRK